MTTDVSKEMECVAIATALSLYFNEESQTCDTKTPQTSSYSPWAFKGLVMRQLPVKK